MRYLLDTDWVVSFLNGRRAAVELVATLATHGIALSIITLGEIYEGLPQPSDYERRRAQVEAFVATLDLITLSPPLSPGIMGVNVLVCVPKGNSSRITISGSLLPLWRTISSSSAATSTSLVSPA